jgi:hypothetical protein
MGASSLYVVAVHVIKFVVFQVHHHAGWRFPKSLGLVLAIAGERGRPGSMLGGGRGSSFSLTLLFKSGDGKLTGEWFLSNRNTVSRVLGSCSVVRQFLLGTDTAARYN